MEVRPTDVYLEFAGCEVTPLEDWPVPAQPLSELAPGTYLVGRDIAPGIYIGEVPANFTCSYQRLRGVSREDLDTIEARTFSEGVRFYVDVMASDYALYTHCDLTLRGEFAGLLTLEEFSVWCTVTDKRAAVKFPSVKFSDPTPTWGDVVAEAQFSLDSAATITPPEELDEWWQARIQWWEATISFASKKPAEEEFQRGELDADSAVEAAVKAYFDAVGQLRDADRTAYDALLSCP